ncbi:hypothetical protein [uncultured Methanobrevibacter sp.]|uniref:hypothetical protein n=1 Tax=uncultured Methanobrevibacter sp. TaxID=253161 RepID=UPI0025F0E04F|nr:hypothetical protein [uncultured Methanobrevibacter sp.]
MNRKTKILMAVLAVFVVGVTLGVAFAEPVNAKTFKTSSGYEWEIKNSTWNNMQKQAVNQYDHMKEVGSSYPGYSDSLNVTVMKDGQSFQGIAFAVKNGNETRCEVRGVLPDGERLNGY